MEISEFYRALTEATETMGIVWSLKARSPFAPEQVESLRGDCAHARQNPGCPDIGYCPLQAVAAHLTGDWSSRILDVETSRKIRRAAGVIEESTAEVRSELLSAVGLPS